MTESHDVRVANWPPASLQVMSDLHLEYGHQYASFEIPPSAPYLVLGGDTGCLSDYEAYREFLQRQVGVFERVFLILGNHEFHGLSYEKGILEARRLVSEPGLLGKVTLLQKSTYEFEDAGLVLLGCTLWSHIPDAAGEAVRGRVKDFQHIDGWSTEQHNSLFDDEVQWLANAVRSIKSRPRSARVLIVTHHAPSVFETSRPEQLRNPWTSAFSTDILQEETWQGIEIWMFGHTHFTTAFEKNDVRVISNQRGYVRARDEMKPRSEPDDHSFDVRRVVSFSSRTA